MACKYFHTINTLTANSTASTLTAAFTTAVTAADKDHFCFKVAAAVPTGSEAYSVLLTINGVATNTLVDKYGNTMTGADLKPCKVYKGYYGATSPHVIVTNYPSKQCGCGCGC